MKRLRQQVETDLADFDSIQFVWMGKKVPQLEYTIAMKPEFIESPTSLVGTGTTVESLRTSR